MDNKVKNFGEVLKTVFDASNKAASDGLTNVYIKDSNNMETSRIGIDLSELLRSAIIQKLRDNRVIGSNYDEDFDKGIAKDLESISVSFEGSGMIIETSRTNDSQEEYNQMMNGAIEQLKSYKKK